MEMPRVADFFYSFPKNTREIERRRKKLNYCDKKKGRLRRERERERESIIKTLLRQTFFFLEIVLFVFVEYN